MVCSSFIVLEGWPSGILGVLGLVPLGGQSIIRRDGGDGAPSVFEYYAPTDISLASTHLWLNLCI